MSATRTMVILTLLLPAVACDSAQENKATADKAAPAGAVAQKAEVKTEPADGDPAADDPGEEPGEEPAEADEADDAAIEVAMNLEQIVAHIETGEVKTAAELEAAFAVDGELEAKIDIDDDGKPDELRVVELREERAATFEIHAVPSAEVAAEPAKAEVKAEAKAEVKAEAKGEGIVAIETAPLLATLRFDAKADAGVVEAKASFDASFAAKLSVDVEETAVMRTFSQVSVDAKGSMEVASSGNAFVAWTFSAERPRYVAAVFEVEVEDEPKADPCWPPGHCKHDLWKATGELPPGQQRKADDDERKPDKADDRGKSGKGKPDKADDKGKPDKGKPAKADDKGKPDKGKPAKADKDKADKGKPDKGKSDKGKSDKGNGKGNGKGSGKNK